MASFFVLQCLFDSGVLSAAAQMHIKTDEIKTAKPDKTINDSGEPGHVAKDKGYKVKAENSDQ